MTLDALLEVSRIERAAFCMAAMNRLDELERLLCGPLSKESRERIKAEYLALTTFPCLKTEEAA